MLHKNCHKANYSEWNILKKSHRIHTFNILAAGTLKYVRASLLVLGKGLRESRSMYDKTFLHIGCLNIAYNIYHFKDSIGDVLSVYYGSPKFISFIVIAYLL